MVIISEGNVGLIVISGARTEAYLSVNVFVYFGTRSLLNEGLHYSFIQLDFVVLLCFFKHVFVYRICAFLKPLGVFGIRCHPARDKVSQTNMQTGPLRRTLLHAQVL